LFLKIVDQYKLREGLSEERDLFAEKLV